jgi:excisionase family DNA binding protein
MSAKEEVERIFDEEIQRILAAKHATLALVAYAPQPAVETEPRQIRWLTKEECAAYMNCSSSSIDKWMKREDNHLPFGQVGADPRFYPPDIDQWMRDEAERRHKKPHTPPPPGRTLAIAGQKGS